MSGPDADAGGRDRADVVVVGDGPAGSALAAACARRGVDVVLVGDDRPWTATYGAWVDEVDAAEGLGDVDGWMTRVEPIVAHGRRCHELGRVYGVVDNDVLRDRLRAGVTRVLARATGERTGTTRHVVELDDGGQILARLVVRATGRPVESDGSGRGPAWQTAFGAVLADRPPGDLGRATFMDFRPIDADDHGAAGSPTFVYALPVRDGWLVEETVLAARPAVDPALLRDRLATRLGLSAEELLGRTARTELVAIPMGGPPPDRAGPVVTFGAAAGYVHPATGFSLTASLRAAPRVADAIVAGLASNGDRPLDPRPVWDAVWPAAARRTRLLHDYGLERMIGLDGAALRDFFDRFFELEPADWSAYLRVDAPPADVSRTMWRMFRSAGWPMRWRLASGNPLPLARLLRP